MTVELVEVPFSFVSQLGFAIIEFPLAVHFIVFPLPFVEASILVVEFPLSVAHTVLFVTLIAATDVVVLDYVLRTIVFYVSRVV